MNLSFPILNFVLLTEVVGSFPHEFPTKTHLTYVM